MSSYGKQGANAHMRKNAHKKKGGSSKGKRIFGKVGAGLGAAAALAGTAYAANAYNQERQANNAAFAPHQSGWSQRDTDVMFAQERAAEMRQHASMRASQPWNSSNFPTPKPF